MHFPRTLNATFFSVLFSLFSFFLPRAFLVVPGNRPDHLVYLWNGPWVTRRGKSFLHFLLVNVFFLPPFPVFILFHLILFRLDFHVALPIPIFPVYFHLILILIFLSRLHFFFA